MSNEAKSNMSKAKIGSNNNMYGKQHTEESRRLISEGKKGQGLGVKQSKESQDKKRATFLNNNTPRECPHCGKIGSGGSMNRWHFDNCKKK